MKECFFIVSCARSGSTSITNILNHASNGECVVEPTPNLNVETRLMMEGRLEDPIKMLQNTIVKRVQKSKYEVYGEKNLTYAPFIKHLYDFLNCKFVFLIRDGRDVVRSLIDWHELVWGNIYRECKNPGNLTERAYKQVSNLPIHRDTSDFSRPRPQPGDPYHEKWLDLTREEMCAWYWQYINGRYIKQLRQIPEEAYFTLDYTKPKVEAIVELTDFLNLQGLSNEKISRMLQRKINSPKTRFGIERRYPPWSEWSLTQRRQFDEIAQERMQELGYYP